MSTDERDTQTIAGKFAEALGCLEDALHWLTRVNAEYDSEEPVGADYGLFPYNPATDFWLQADLAEKAVKDRLRRLQRVAPLAPKEAVQA